MDTLAIVAVITSISSLLVICGKTIKNSTCLGCLKFETRTPQPSVDMTNAPTPEYRKNTEIITLTEYHV